MGGDFNNPLNFEDRLGSVIRWHEIEKFRNCVELHDFFDMKSNGAKYTWNNKQLGDDRDFSKIDQTLINLEWTSTFPSATTCFMPEGLFDHSPIVVKFLHADDNEKKSFKYLTCLVPCLSSRNK